MNKFAIVGATVLGAAFVGAVTLTVPGTPVPTPIASNESADGTADLGTEQLGYRLFLSENNYWEGDRGMN